MDYKDVAAFGEFLEDVPTEEYKKTMEKLKNYFTIQRKSGGGDCEVKIPDDRDGRGTFLVIFQSEEVRDRVVKRNHEIVLNEGHVVRIKLRKVEQTSECTSSGAQPSHTPGQQQDQTVNPAANPEGSNTILITYDGIADTELKVIFEDILQYEVEFWTLKHNTKLLICQTPEEVNRIRATVENKFDGKILCVEAWTESNFVDSCRIKLENLDENTALEMVEMFIELCSRRFRSEFDVEYARDGRSAIVTFQQPIEWKLFQKVCLSRKLCNQVILATPLLFTKWLCVEGFSSSITQAVAQLYFQKEAKNYGGKLNRVLLKEEEQMAYIQFDNFEVVKQVLEKQHFLQKSTLQTYHYYKEDDVVIRGQNKPDLQIPSEVPCSVDTNIFTLIVNNPSYTKFTEDCFKSICAQLQFDQSSSSIVVKPNFVVETIASLNLAKYWEVVVHEKFESTMSNFVKETFPTSHPEVWDRVKDEMAQLTNEARIISFDPSLLKIHLLGEVNDVDVVREKVKNVVQKAHSDIQFEHQYLNKFIPMQFYEFELLQMLKVDVDLKKDFPDVSLQLQDDKQCLSFKGMQKYFDGVKDKLQQHLKTLTQKDIALTMKVTEFVCQPEMQHAINEKFQENSITALVACSTKVILHSTKACLQKAETFLKTEISEQHFLIPKSSRLYTKGKTWTDFLKSLKHQSVGASRSCNVWANYDSDGCCSSLDIVAFSSVVAEANKQLESFCEKYAFIETFFPLESLYALKYLTDVKQITKNQSCQGKNIKADFESVGFILSGHPNEVAKLKDFISNHKVVFHKMSVDKPGAIKVAEEKEEDLENLYKKHDCMGKIDDPNSVQHLDSKRYRANLRSGHTVSVFFGNLLYQPGDVIVNAANGELRHIGGLAKAISDAAGPVVQKECDAHVQKHGKLTEGEVFVSSSGRLSCKKIIHAVGPRWNSHSSKVAVGLLFHAVTNCLKEAEKGQYKSIVFPAISGGIFAFPVRECSQTIVDAIVAYCEDVSNSQHTLKDIHIVDLNDKVVSALKDALQVKLGQKASVGKKASQHYPGIKLPSGVCITMVAGNLEDEKSDVIVNSVSGSMQLNEGKLSNSILQKAGPHLQAVFDQTVHNVSTSAKEVIQTPAVGNLKCKEVYHVPLQAWVKDRPISGKVLCNAVRTCLNLVEKSGLHSISFPALGSGHLSYPAHLTATFMLREVLRFCDEQVPTSITDVRFVLHPQDDLILKAFQEVMNSISQTGASSIAGNMIIGNLAVTIDVGDITTESTQAIVCSPGVFRAVLSASGHPVQVLGQMQQSVVSVIQPGNLHCQHIIVLHVQKNNIKMCTSNALMECHRRSFTSVAFPALCTGGGGLSPAQGAAAMADAFKEFIQQNPMTSLSEIRIIIYMCEMYKDFCEGFVCKQSSIFKPLIQGWKTLNRFFTGASSGSGLSGMHVEVIQGDITKETTDAIVNSTSPTFDLQQGVSGAILQAAGASVQLECQKHGQQSHPGLMVTSSGNLACNYIVHVVGRAQPAEISACVRDALQQCERLNIASVALPAIGTGAGSQQAAMAADAMLEAIMQHTPTSLNHIRIVVFQPQMVADFQAALQKAIQTTGANTKVKTKPMKPAGLVLPVTKLKPLHLIIIGSEQRDIDRCVKEVQDFFTSSVKSEKVKIKGRLKEKDVKTLLAIQEEHQVEIRQSSNYLVLEGTELDVKDAHIKLLSMITENQHQEVTAVPPYWEEMEGCLFKTFTLVPNSPEYNKVSQDFLQSVQSNCAIVKIERIQNAESWERYLLRKKHVSSVSLPERTLYHGTHKDASENIRKFGFDRNYAGKNAIQFGKGTYFAVNAAYSAQQRYSPPDTNGHRYIFQALVAIGDFCQGNSSLIAPPPKGNSEQNVMYDSLVDNVQNPNIFVIFQDDQAYPEYLITFH